MSRRERITSGIEIQDHEIRLVQVKAKSGRQSATAALTEPLPAGAVLNGVIQQPGLVAVALQKIVDRAPNANTSEIVVGVAPSATAVRSIALPDCSDAEFAPLLQTEVQFQRLLQGSGGAYGFIELAHDAQGSRQAAIVACEQVVIDSYNQGLDAAMLDPIALEPTQFGTVRVFMDQGPKDRASLLLISGATATDLIFFIEGQPVFVRRIDAGSKGLIEGATQLGSGFFPKLYALDHLCTEVRRSIDYLMREFEEASALETVCVAIDHEAVLAFMDVLQDRIGFRVQALVGQIPCANAQLEHELCNSGDSPRFAAALGLALFDAKPAAPRVDLLGKYGAPMTLSQQVRLLYKPMALAAGILAVGIAVGANFNTHAATVSLQAKDVSKKAAEVRLEADLAMGEQARRLKQFDVLKKEGVPLSMIMDELARGVGPGVGFTAVHVDDGLGLRLEGEATSEAAMLQTLQNLRPSPVIKDISVTSFGRDEARPTGLKFEFSGSTISMSDVKVAGQEDKQP